MSDSGAPAKRCSCPVCSSAISIIALMRSVRANKIKCSACGTEVYARIFWLYWLLDRLHEGGVKYVMVALIIAFDVWYMGSVFVQARDQLLFILFSVIITMIVLSKAEGITKRHAMQFFSGLSARRCSCPDCSNAISIIALMRSLWVNKIECPACGTAVSAQTFWLYWLLDRLREGVFFCIACATIMAITIMAILFLYVWLFHAFNENIFLAAVAITSIVLLAKAKDIIKQCALQLFSIRKYAGFPIRLPDILVLATIGLAVGLVWWVLNGIFLIDYAWATDLMLMQEVAYKTHDEIYETYGTIISSGNLFSFLELLFWGPLLLVVPYSLLYCLYMIAFQMDVRKALIYKMLLAVYLACGMVILPVKISSIVSFYINKSFAAEIDQGAQPLSVYIESFINDYGRPPENLQELVPEYVDSSAVMMFEKYPYGYGMVSVDGQNFGALYVAVYCGNIDSCAMVRLFGHNYAHSNKVESFPDPRFPKESYQRLNRDSMRSHGMHAFLNQNWSYYTLPLSS